MAAFHDPVVGAAGAGAAGASAIAAQHLRRVVHVPTGLREQGWRGGLAFAAALTAAVTGLPARARLSLTWDQGVEMARHDLVAHLFPDGVYFADAGRPWQRGTNENTNGLLRQYLPRSADLSTFTRDDLDRIEQLMNNRPRKTLSWATPAQVFAAGAP